tara:strand:+ start:768 stop:1334 length:567 start_codon:yes stop_codon:yes gene_type:complete
MDINKLIAVRRAVYPSQFNMGEIDKDALKQLLENANMAPTHKMTQPWFFKIYKNKAKTRLGKAMVHAMKVYSPLDLRQDFKKKKIFEKCRLSNCVLGIFMKRSTEVSIPEWEEIAAVAMAVQNIWLSCVDQKIGCYWSSPQYTSQMRSFFDLNADERCLGFMYMGKFDHTTLPVKERKDMASKVEWLV